LDSQLYKLSFKSHFSSRSFSLSSILTRINLTRKTFRKTKNFSNCWAIKTKSTWSKKDSPIKLVWPWTISIMTFSTSKVHQIRLLLNLFSPCASFLLQLYKWHSQYLQGEKDSSLFLFLFWLEYGSQFTCGFLLGHRCKDISD